MTDAKRKQKIAFCVVGAGCLTAALLSLCMGKYPISVREILDILAGKPVDELSRSVFLTLRLSRTLMVLLSGLALGMAGSIYQTIFKNPLADPDIIGVVKGANLGAAVAIVAMGNQIFPVALSAFAGGLLAVFLVMALVRAARVGNMFGYVLAGIVVSAISEALIMLLKFFADPEKELAAIEFWAMGSFGGVTMEKFRVVAPICLAAILGLVLLRRQISMLALEEDESRALGVRVGRIRILVLTLTTLMVAVIICVTGRIAFLGLIAPHIGRLVFRRNGFSTTVFSAMVGALILTLADCVARTAYSVELPISVVTTLVGVPFLVYFMCHRRREGQL
ncbi:MAG: iron ABC transporter permease [Clostridia bacterium]|nr:iron ABC transporter permease [Clostridia bacterium]